MTSTELITLPQVEDALLHGGALDVISPEAVQDDMVQRINDSLTLEEAFQSFQATPASEMDGIAVIVHGIAWMRSAFKEGPQVYALLNAEVAESHDPVTISMGGRTLMMSFVWAMRNDAMPIAGTFRKRQSRSDPEKSFWTFDLAPTRVES